MSTKLGVLTPVQANALESDGIVPEAQFVTWKPAKDVRLLIGDQPGYGEMRWVDPSDSKFAYRYVTPVKQILRWAQRPALQRLSPDVFLKINVMQPVYGQ